jgi:S-adenosylmethionine hydrolase
MSAPIITLTTDFGVSDGYVATIKGVIFDICPDARIIDVSHDILPQNVEQAAFVLNNTARYFPANSVHVAVVDPGVGTDRKPILLDTPTGSFIGPDNGIFSYVLKRLSDDDTSGTTPASCQAYLLDKQKYWLCPVSGTFHGRDIFAPVAAYIGKGVARADVGTPVNTLVKGRVSVLLLEANHIEGRLLQVDRFGNLISNIPEGMLDREIVSVRLAGRTIPHLNETYSAGRGLVALVGSHGYLEVAWRNGNAAKVLGVGFGETIVVELKGIS